MAIGTFDRPVTAPDSALNVEVGDVVGNKTDAASEAATASIIALLRAAGVRLDSVRQGSANAVYPNLAAGATATADAAGWTYGLYAEVAAAGPANAYKVTGICVDSPSAGDLYQVEIATGAGAAEVPYATIKFECSTDAGFVIPLVLTGAGEIVGATRIAARIACAGAVARTLGISVITEEIV